MPMPKLSALLPLPARLAKLSPALALLSCLTLPDSVLAQAGSPQGLACLQLVEALANDGRVPLQGVTFDFNRATLRPDSLPAMIAARDAILTLGGTWGIEGHTDNVGSRSYNQNLSEARAQSVRDWLVSAGVSAAQLSAQGFSFDRPIADNSSDAGRAQNRRVELVGTVTPDMLGFGGPDGTDPCPDTLTSATFAAAGEVPPPPPIPDWSGAAGQEWLPFSLLMTTGDGTVAGWSGERIEMRPGARPETCQALCAAQSACAAFSFEPAGSNFVENARCTLTGYGTELSLRRSNVYLDGGTFYTSGLKPDAHLLTPESEEIAQDIIADLAEIAQLRDTVRITAPDAHPPDSWMDVAVDGAVSGDAYSTYLEITLSPDHDFDWRLSKSRLLVPEMPDGRSGQIWAPEPGTYVLRYVINHPTAGQHTITAQPLVVTASASGPAPAVVPQTDAATPQPARSGTVETGIDRPGMDIAQTPMTSADPLMCQALCADDADCASWTYVKPGLQAETAICWTKSGVPEGFANDCCTSGVMNRSETYAPVLPVLPVPPVTGGTTDTASLSFPAAVAPGESIAVSYSGPLHAGDWVDIITTGHDDDMSGGWSWAYVTGDPVTLTAPDTQGEYTLRYVAEDPQRGRVVLAQETLVTRIPAAVSIDSGDIFKSCDGSTGPFCDIVLPDQDVGLTLAAGYGMTEPLVYETTGGTRADRPAFDIMRLSDKQQVIRVNARQAQASYCQTGPSGDNICLTDAFGDSDALLAGVVFGSLTSTAMQAETAAMGEDQGTQDAIGDLQGVWVFAFDTPGLPEDGADFIVIDLRHDAASDMLDGNFTTSPVLGPLTGLSGDLTGLLQGETLDLSLVGANAPNGYVFNGTQYGAGAYRGTVHDTAAPQDSATSVILRQIAAPGEAWQGAPWMTGRPDGMEAAMQAGANALQELIGDTDAADRAVVDMLGAVMGAIAGARDTTSTDTSVDPVRPRQVDLDNLSVDGLMEQLFPFGGPAP